jgi:hypothetical protein
MSNATPHKHQGIAASVMNTVVNYSISIGLGIAGTVESRVNRDGQDPFAGIRGAQYVGIGLAGLGVLVSIIYIVVSTAKRLLHAEEESEIFSPPSTVDKSEA